MAPSDQLIWAMDAMRKNPLSFFEELRAHRPSCELGGVVFVARYADVVEIFRHPTVFSVRLYKPKMGDFMLTHDETPTHRRDKSVMSAMLPLTDAPRVTTLADKFAGEAIRQSKGEIEIVGGLARKVPIQMVQEYFGLDGVEETSLRRWSSWSQYDNFHNHPFQQRPNAAEISAEALKAKTELAQYAQALVKRRLMSLPTESDRDDIVARLLKSQFPASVGFGLDRVVANVMGLLIGAVETTSHAVAAAIDELLRRPDTLKTAAQYAREGKREQLARLVTEANRFQPISPYMFRFCEEDFVIAKGTNRERTIRKGATVLLLTQSAMFDAQEFAAPQEFREERPDYQSFLFGYGNHRCLGEFVGRTMIPACVNALVLKNNVRRAEGVAGEIDFKGGPFPESLTVKFDA
ncbi:MAG: cytochrome P450 [Pirellulales bacterium]